MSWPDKTLPEFTDAELATAIQEHEHDPDSTQRSLVQSCWREIERRHGLTDTD